MVVIDTSVWVDLLRERQTPGAETCRSLIRHDVPIALTDIVFTELLEGVVDERNVARLEERLREFPILRLERLGDFRLAAELSRTARRAGITIQSKLDYLIAARCIRADAPLLHSDADFDRLASCTPLRVFDSPQPA